MLARDLTCRLGVTPPKDDQAARRGVAFDRAFVRHEVAYHEAVIAAVQSTLLPAIRNAEVKERVVKVAPAFQAHVLAAENLGRQLATR